MAIKPDTSIASQSETPETTGVSRRKPHSNWAGYRSERRNPHSGGHTVIVDCKLAQEQGNPWVADYVEEGGRYMVVCDSHSCTCHATSMPKAMDMMIDPTSFCEACRAKADKAPEPLPPVDTAGAVADAAYLIRGFSEADEDGHASYSGHVEEMRGME